MQKILLAIIVAILGMHLAGNYYGWYLTTHLDIPMHLSGGLWTALFFFYIFGEKWSVLNFEKHKFASLVLTLGFVALVGVSWEMYEYAAATLLKHNYAFTCAEPGGLFDTLKDLFDDLVGGFIASLILWWRTR